MTERILPTEQTPSSMNIDDWLVLIYGQEGAGKTETFTWHKPETTLFIDIDRRLVSSTVNKIQPENWEDLVEWMKIIKRDKGKYERIIVDTIDGMYDMCRNHICEKEGIKFEALPPNKIGYEYTRAEFVPFFHEMRKLPMGLIFIGNRANIAKEKQPPMWIPSYGPNKTLTLTTHHFNLIAYCQIEPPQIIEGSMVEKRSMYLQANSFCMAKSETPMADKIEIDSRTPKGYNLFMEEFERAAKQKQKAIAEAKKQTKKE